MGDVLRGAAGGHGLPPAEAGALLVEKTLAILAHDAAGNRLEALLA